MVSCQTGWLWDLTAPPSCGWQARRSGSAGGMVHLSYHLSSSSELSLLWSHDRFAFSHSRVCSVPSFMSDSVLACRLPPARTLCPWNSPGKNTGVGCHFLLQGIFPTQGSNLHLLGLPALAVRVFTTSTSWKAPLVGYLCPALYDTIDHRPLGSAIHKTFQAGLLQWFAISFPTWQFKHRQNELQTLFKPLLYHIC